MFPPTPPNWNPNTAFGREALDHYRQVLLRGIRVAARKPTNLSKVTETKQRPNESPAAFLERLCEAYHTDTPIDPDAPDNRAALAVQFVGQSAPNIRKKIQKMEGFEGKSLTELVATAQRVFENREDPTQALTEKMAKVLVAMEERGRTKKPKGGRDKRQSQGKRKPLDRDQCAYCKEYRHWKNECPKRPGASGATPLLVEEVD